MHSPCFVDSLMLVGTLCLVCSEHCEVTVLFSAVWSKEIWLCVVLLMYGICDFIMLNVII